jgi:hypothetical protein
MQSPLRQLGVFDCDELLFDRFSSPLRRFDVFDCVEHFFDLKAFEPDVEIDPQKLMTAHNKF